jgi:hypothetical protein
MFSVKYQLWYVGFIWKGVQIEVEVSDWILNDQYGKARLCAFHHTIVQVEDLYLNNITTQKSVFTIRSTKT